MRSTDSSELIATPQEMSVLKDKKRWYTLLIILLACSILIAVVTVITKSGHEFEHAPSVQIDFGPSGTVSGRVIVAEGGERINVYRNIPYAVPPLKVLYTPLFF